jgi:hypothetical protein
MFNDRDLGILGAGALLAVLCLFLPFSFAGKVVIGFLVLVGFMVLALLRLGPDRVPPEVWLSRRFRYSMQTRQYVNQQAATRRTESEPKSSKQKPERPATSFNSQPVMRPIDLAWDEVGVYPLLSMLLGVIGVYFVVWLARGGAEELSLWFG